MATHTVLILVCFDSSCFQSSKQFFKLPKHLTSRPKSELENLVPIDAIVIINIAVCTYFVAYVYLRFKHAVLGTQHLCGLSRAVR